MCNDGVLYLIVPKFDDTLFFAHFAEMEPSGRMNKRRKEALFIEINLEFT